MIPCPRFIRPLCAALALVVAWNAGAQEPADPFLADADVIRAMIPPEGLTREVRVDVEWIALPHAAAAALLHAVKTPADLASLRDRVLPLLETGGAVRVNLMTTVVRSMQRGAVRGALEFPHPSGHSKARTSRRLWLDGRTAPGETLPAIPTSFGRSELGHTLEADVNLSDEGVVSLLLSHEWRIFIGAENRGAQNRRWATFGECGGMTTLELPPGQWSMVSLNAVPGPAAESAMPADAQVVVFARVGAQGVPEPAAGAMPPPGLVHVEWIEAESALLTPLNVQPGMDGAAEVRAALEPALAAGRVRLAASAAAAFSTRPDDSALRTASGQIRMHDAAKSDQGVRVDARGGSRIDLVTDWTKDLHKLHITGDAELSIVDGFDEHANGVETPRRVVRLSPVDLSLPSGQTALVSVLDPLPQTQPTAPAPPAGSAPVTRKLLVFVRAIF